MNLQILNGDKKIKWIEIALFSVLIIQFAMCIYFNLQLLENHMGFDSSWSYLKAGLMWNEKSIVSDVWQDQTNIFLDSSMPIASIIYGMTGKLLLSYGLANILVLILIMICLDCIMREMSIKVIGRLFALNLVICPYLTNGFGFNGADLGYLNNLISGPAFYALRTLIVLLIILEFIRIRKNKKIGLLSITSFFLCALAGVSSGIFIFVMILIPYLLYEVECMLIDNDVRVLIRMEAIYAYICCASVFIGKIFASNILKIKTIDATRTWTPLTKLWINMGAVIQGLMSLLNVLPVADEDIAILTKEGMYRLFPLFIFLVVVLSIVYTIKVVIKNVKTENGIIHFILNVILCNFITFSLFNVRYGAAIFEERYLICTFMALVILIVYYINNLDSNHIFSVLLCVGLLISLVGNNYVSDKKYIQTTNESWQMAEIYHTVSEGDSELIYFWGHSLSIIARSMRVYDMDRVYKLINNDGHDYYHWGDYTYYDNNDDYDGATYLVVSKFDINLVPENILSQYTLVQELNHVNIYRCESNPIDMYSGFTSDTSIDYPYSPGMYLCNGQYDGGSYISDGTKGYVMYGPYADTPDGIYDFILSYEIIEEGDENAIFDVVLDNAAIQLGKMELEPHKMEAVISDIAIDSGHKIEYRVYCGEGVKIKINKITLLKK